MARVKRTEKKGWFQLVAPKIFHNQVVGEILLANPSDAVGRLVPVNLANLTRDPRRQNIKIKLKAINVSGEKIHTEPLGYEISSSFVRKMVRKGGTRIDYTFRASTSDDKNVRIKIILLTRRKINASVSAALKKKAEEILKKEMEKMNFSEMMQAIVAYKLQSGMKKQLAKVYPLKTFEIRHLSVEKGKKIEESLKPKKKAEEIKEKPSEKAEEKKQEEPKNTEEKKE